jgi:hypothetical protein
MGRGCRNRGNRLLRQVLSGEDSGKEVRAAVSGGGEGVDSRDSRRDGGLGEEESGDLECRVLARRGILFRGLFLFLGRTDEVESPRG